ncbi:MAG TPA: tetratricopeptide repeat protein, partial [Bryobacteraceae bacterium]|nr:tetratricopeptide repeat protein [Bryobacteraceae bacterium]
MTMAALTGQFQRAAVVAAGFLFLAGCRGTPQEREAKRVAQGKAYLEKKDYKRAVIEFKVASQNMPKDAEPVYQLGMAYLKGGAVRPGLEALQKANKLDPKHEGARYQLALFGVGSNNLDMVEDAKKVISEHLAAHPDDVEAIGSLALAEAKLGNRDEAVKLLEQAAAKDPSNMRFAGMVIAVYAAKGETDAAKAIARDLTTRFPNSSDAAVLRAQTSLATRDFADTDAEVSRALSIRRDFQPALELRLRRELMNADPASAEQTTQELARLPEKRTWAAYARILFTERKIDQAIAEFNRVLREHGDTAELRDEFAELLIGARRDREAEDIVAGTLKKDPKDKAALLDRATLEINRGNLDAAAKDIKTLEELKAFSPQLTFQQARIYGARGDLVKQGDTLTEALKADPRLLGARLELARVMVSMGKAKNALEMLDQASPAEKRTTEYLYYRNMALIAGGDWDEAKKGVAGGLAATRTPGLLYQDALIKMKDHDLAGARQSLDAGFRMAPADPLTLAFLGDVMRRQGQGAGFTALLKDAAARNPGSATIQNALGKQLLAQGDRAGARAAFEAAKADGDVVSAEIEIASLDLAAGAVDPARQRLENLIKTRDNATARMMLADIETRRGASADAVIQHYLKAISLEPSNALAMNNLAETLSAR